MTPLRLTREEVEALRVHGVTLTNGEGEPPKWDEVCDGDGSPAGWDIWVADGQVCASVPQFPQTDGEASDGGPLTDWRDAICVAGMLMLGAHADLLTLHAEVERLRAELAKPVAGAWVGCIRSVGGYSVAFSLPADVIPGDDECGWWAQHPDGTLIASGPETGNAGRRACDLALAATYRLVGGVFGGEP
jgi:hypothetical protein